jgi:hypothetical protein
LGSGFILNKDDETTPERSWVTPVTISIHAKQRQVDGRSAWLTPNDIDLPL